MSQEPLLKDKVVVVTGAGRVDAVVNNAGTLRDAIFHKMSEEDFYPLQRSGDVFNWEPF